MASEETPAALVAAGDAETRAQFLGLLADHQLAIANLVAVLNAREEFGKARALHAQTAMRVCVASFERTGDAVSNFADENIGEG